METKANVPFLDLKAQHAPLRDEIFHALHQVVDASAFAGGPFVEKFEQEFAEFCHSSHCVGVGNGTDSLWFTLLALGVEQGDEIIIPTMTFMATAEAVTYAGALPVFVDIDPHTFTLDVGQVEAAITDRTRAIIPVHLFGQCADMKPLLSIAQKHGLHVIEDAAQAHGATYRGQPAGTIGIAGSFSFYPGKNLGAWGEAGAVISSDPQLVAKIRQFRDHGQGRKYYHDVIGWNGRMDGIQAAVLSVKLKHLAQANLARRKVAAWYDARLRTLDEVKTPCEDKRGVHVYHIYAIRVSDRNNILEKMRELGVGCGIHYPVPIHRQKAYHHLGYQAGAFPISEDCASSFISLPMYPELTEIQVEHVVSALEKALAALN